MTEKPLTWREEWIGEAHKYGVNLALYCETRLVLEQGEYDDEGFAKSHAREIARGVTAEDIRGGRDMSALDLRDWIVGELSIPDSEKEEIRKKVGEYRKKMEKIYQEGASLVFGTTQDSKIELPDKFSEAIKDFKKDLVVMDAFAKELSGGEDSIKTLPVAEDENIVSKESEQNLKVNEGVDLAKNARLKRLKNLEKKKKAATADG